MRSALVGLVAIVGGCALAGAASPRAPGGPVFRAYQPYQAAHVIVVLGGPAAIDGGAAPVRVSFGPPGTDRCDQPPTRTVVDLPDGDAVAVTLLARGRTCVVEGRDRVAIDHGGWELGVRVPADACAGAEWALPGAHPHARLVLTETTRFYEKAEADALPPDERERLLATADSAATLILEDAALPFQVYELWRNASPLDGVRLRRGDHLVRVLPARPSGFVVDGAQVSAILRRGDGFRSERVDP